MLTLLEKRHPDIPQHSINCTLRYRHEDEKGNIIEALERKSLDEDFVDVTKREQKRQKLEAEIYKQEKELERLERK